MQVFIMVLILSVEFIVDSRRYSGRSVMKNGRKLMSSELTQEHSGDVWGLIGMRQSDPGCSWLIHVNSTKS